MIGLQDDLRELYNQLIVFSSSIDGETPIKVSYIKEEYSLRFDLDGKSVYTIAPFYCSLDMDKVKNTYLLMRDYKKLLDSLNYLLTEGILVRDRVMVVPEKYGFDVVETENTTKDAVVEGPKVIATIRFISGNSWFFRFMTKRAF